MCVVSEDLALRGTYLMDLESEVDAEVGPVYKHHLHKFQVLLFKLKVIFRFSKTCIMSVFLPMKHSKEELINLNSPVNLNFIKETMNKQQNICSFFLSRLEFAVVPNMRTKDKIWYKWKYRDKFVDLCTEGQTKYTIMLFTKYTS